jgi:hypothetical protein
MAGRLPVAGGGLLPVPKQQGGTEMAKLVMGKLPEGMTVIKGFAFGVDGVWHAYADEEANMNKLLLAVVTGDEAFYVV